MAFSVIVEMLNIKAKAKQGPGRVRTDQ